MLDVLRACVRLMASGPRIRWVLVVTLALLVAGVEAVGAGLILVLLGVVTGEADALDLPVIGDFRQLLPPGWDEQTTLLALCAFIGGFFVVRAVLLIARAYVESRVVEKTGARIATQLMKGYLALPYANHLQRNSSEMVRNAHESVQVIVRDGLRPLLKLVSQGVLALGIIAVLLASSPLATLMAVFVLGPCIYVLLSIVQPRVKRLGRKTQQQAKSTLQMLQQSLHGVRDIKVIGRERHFESEFRRSRLDLAHARYMREALKFVPRAGVETALILFIVVFFGATVLREGSAVGALPVLGLFGYAALRLQQPMNELLNSVNALRFSGAALEDVQADLRIGKEAIARNAREPAPEPLPFERELRIDNVWFCYPGSPEYVLRGIDLRIARGQSIGIVGPTGGGKSTLVDVILGLLEPTSGAVRVDGVDISEAPRSWQRNLGVVPQSLFMIDDTLKRNIALGYSDDAIDETRMAAAIRMAQLESVLTELPDGLDTMIGERGVRLSGGQRQRVAIARALYRDPAVLLFDEATSALDNRTEADLLETIQGLQGERTLLTVAHRLTTVRDCDAILVVHGGEIVDCGTYDELAERNATFRSFVGGDQHQSLG